MRPTIYLTWQRAQDASADAGLDGDVGCSPADEQVDDSRNRSWPLFTAGQNA